MSISKAASLSNTSGDLCCPKCGSPLPPRAAFCSICGERLDNKFSSSSYLYNEQDITSRYRMTSLVRRRPFVSLYFALDNQQSLQGRQRMVAVRDIDLTSIDNDSHVQAIQLVQREYDSLRLWNVPHFLPVIDMRFSRGHLYTISGYPLATSRQDSNGLNRHPSGPQRKMLRLYTLQDYLQSGLGLPTEQQAITWIQDLCLALDVLHQHQMVMGELDPYTIILNENSDKARPALMVSWLSPQLQKFLHSSDSSTKFWSYFSAPEALHGKAEPRSDIYSLGAVLYLLLTGSIPSERSLRNKGRLRAPRELNNRVSLQASACVMQALEAEPSKRFQNAEEFSTALSNPRYTRQLSPKLNRREAPVTSPPQVVPVEEAQTVRIVPLSQKHLERWQASPSQVPTSIPIPHRPLVPPSVTQSEAVETRAAATQKQLATPSDMSLASTTASIDTSREKDTSSSSSSTVSAHTSEIPAQSEASISLFQHFQRFILGQQKRAIFSAALIESPISVRPDQVFMLRIHIMGRDEPAPPGGSQGTEQSSGLSTLMNGDTLTIVIRSVINQNFALVVQQSAVSIPSAGYIAEITLPLKPYVNLPDGMRERLTISFLDKQQRPLYKNPFSVEVFVSRYVKPGHEGYHVLAIPH